MKLRSRILIVPDPDLNDTMYRKANSLAREIAKDWNTDKRPKIDELGLVILEYESAEYNELRRLFLRKAKASPRRWLEWNESLEAVYSRAELERFEILQLWINGDAGEGGNAYAQVYDTSTCKVCGGVTIHSQVQDMVLNVARIRTDIASTNFSEIAVSERFRELLLDVRVSGVEFRSIIHARPSRPAKRQFYQMIIHNVIGPIVAPKRTWLKHCRGCGRGLERKDAEPIVIKPDSWTVIGKIGPGPWSESHFPRRSYHGWDIMRTAETFGGPTSPDLPAPETPAKFIGQRLYRLLRQHRIKGYWVAPAHLH